MPQVEIAINGRRYQIACDEGQEEHLARLGRQVDDRVRGLVASVGQVGERRLLVMASLLIADELSEASAALDRRGDGAARDGAARDGEADGDADALAAALESAAARIDDIAAGLERG